MRRKIIGIFIVMLMITTCVVPVMGELLAIKKSSNDANSLHASNTVLKFMIAGKAIRALHSYWIHVPPSYDGSKPVPLVLVFQGTAPFYPNNPFLWFRQCIMEEITLFSEKADEEGFIVVYPNAKLLPHQPLSGDPYVYDYNYGWIPSLGLKNVDDIGFIRILIEKIKQEYIINASRIYITGFSAGGIMSYSIGAYLSDVVAAIAPVAGTIGGRTNENNPFSYIPTYDNPISVIVFHGTSDMILPYQGSSLLISVNESVSFWVEHNECNPTPEINTSVSGHIIRSTYTNGEKGTEVVLYTTIGGTHTWPPYDDPYSAEISATDLIWEFFEAHPKQ